MEHANRTVLIAANDIVVREICARFLHSEGFFCTCINFDEKLLTYLGKVRPTVLISELSFLSRCYSPTDFEAAFCHLMAARCKLPGLLVFTVHSSDSWEFAERSRKLGMAGHYTYPLDLAKMLSDIRFQLRRLSLRSKRVRNAPGYIPEFSANPGRGRPRKYPLGRPQEATPVPAVGVYVA